MIRRLRKEELHEYASRAGWRLGEDEVEEFHTLSEAMFDLLEPFDAEPSVPVERIQARREPGRRPTREEDPYNAVVRWCSVKADREGLLSGKRIGLKDNMSVAGVPMTFGSRVLHYAPQADAVLVERVLAAGGEIVAMLNMENFAWSGGGETSHWGPVLNPHDTTRTAAGSSGGSAAALFYDGIDITYGGDQGGSIRLPAAWCGVLGHKPTYGLVPYTGIGAIDPTYDHAGPYARTVVDLALALEVVAGKHESDPRQGEVPTQEYRRLVSEARDDLRGVRIGVLKEGFGFDGPEAPPGTTETEEATMVVVEQLRELGADVRDVSVPQHLAAGGIVFSAIVQGQTAVLDAAGNGYGLRGRYDEDLARALGTGLRNFGDELPPTVKLITMLGKYLQETYFGALYAKAQNAAPRLRAAYDAALADVDVLVMPTATHYAHTHEPNASISERVLRGWDMLANTAPFDTTGHPALSMPAAEADGLPVGVMVVGRHFQDAEIFQLARTYEAAHGWRPELQTRAAAPVPA